MCPISRNDLVCLERKYSKTTRIDLVSSRRTLKIGISKLPSKSHPPPFAATVLTFSKSSSPFLPHPFCPPAIVGLNSS